MKIKYSVIVPVYNAEGTIARCVESLIDSTRCDYEIIIINDGATDGTKQICMRYKEQCPQIVYMEKEHGGVSSARNLGISVARGEYILFVDADDYVCNGYFNELDKHMHAGCDLLMFSKIIFDGLNEKRYCLKDCCMQGRERTIKFMCKSLKQQLLNSPWDKVFRADIIHKHLLRFDETLVIGEDKVFVLQYIMHITNARFIKQPLYVVSLENENSLSRKNRTDLCDQVLREHGLLFKAVEDANLPEKQKVQLGDAVNYSYYRSAYTVISKLYKLKYTKEERLNKTKEVCDKYITGNVDEYSSFRQWLISIPIRKKMVRFIDFVLLKKCSDC